MHLPVKQLEASSSKYISLEYSSILLRTSTSTKTIVLCLYRRQEIHISHFLKDLEALIDKLVLSADSLIIMGDFNVWAEDKENNDSLKLHNLMCTFGLEQFIDEPTHNAGHILDHVYANPFQISIKAEVQQEKYDISTDHSPVLVSLPITCNTNTQRYVSVRKMKNINLDSFRSELLVTLGKIDVNHNSRFSADIAAMKNCLIQVLNVHAPITKVKEKNTSSSPRWMDHEFKIVRAKRRKMEKIWRRNKNEQNRLNYIEQRDYCAALSIEKQKLYYSNLINVTDENNKSMYKLVDEMLDKNQSKKLPSHTDPLSLANRFNEFFVAKVNNIRHTINAVSVVPDFETFTGTPLANFEPVTGTELEVIVKTHGIKTSADDPLPSKLLSSVIDILFPYYVELINKSFRQYSMEGLKRSVINPLHKGNMLDVDELKSYRPVNNLKFFSKVIERVVFSRLNHHLESNHLNIHNQYGYKKHHSTELMLLDLTNDILEGFDRQQCTIIVFLDLSAAFDTIDVNILIDILEKEIGITDNALKWFKSFLSGRTQRVKIGDSFSKETEVQHGVTQGSILEPTLFNIYTRSQPKIFSRCGYKSSSFADDINGRKRFSLIFQYDVLKNGINECLSNVAT